MRYALFLVCFLGFAGCGNSAENPKAIALLKKHGTVGIFDEKIWLVSLHEKAGVGRGDTDELILALKEIEGLGELRINGNALKKKHLQSIAALPHLTVLRLRGCGLDDKALEVIKEMSNLKWLGITHTPITDEGLKHLAQLRKIKRLELPKTKIRGPGLAHLKGFDQLEWLGLGSTPLDDSGIPHIVANFPKLKRLQLDETNITPDGLMQLVDLHWLQNLAPPSDMLPRKHMQAQGEERTRLLQEERKARKALMLKFDTAHLASKRKARAAGMEVPSDTLLPFSSQELIEQIEREEKLRKAVGNP